MTNRLAVNLVAALGLLVADEQLRAVERASGLTGGAAAALVVIGYAPGESIDFLRRVLNRSHSAVVRMVATLEQRGLLERTGADDGRAVALVLTTAGKRLVGAVLAGREATVADRLSVLSDKEADTLRRIAGKLLNAAVTDEVAAFRICRLCDSRACDDGACPVEAAFGNDA